MKENASFSVMAEEEFSWKYINIKQYWLGGGQFKNLEGYLIQKELERLKFSLYKKNQKYLKQ